MVEADESPDGVQSSAGTRLDSSLDHVLGWLVLVPPGLESKHNALSIRGGLNTNEPVAAETIVAWAVYIPQVVSFGRERFLDVPPLDEVGMIVANNLPTQIR